MAKNLMKRVQMLFRDEAGLATVEWIGLGIVILAALVVVANAMKNADGTSLATEILNAIGRMVGKIE